jgi:hypothetical protein
MANAGGEASAGTALQDKPMKEVGQLSSINQAGSMEIKFINA